MSGHEHGHDHYDNGHEHDPPELEQMQPRFVDIVDWLRDQSAVALAEEGEHASVVFLGLPDGHVRAKPFDATTQEEVAEEWGRVATWAKGVQANAVYFIGEAKREDEDTGEEEDVLFFAGLNSEGEEAAYETPFGRNEDGTITLGESEPSDDAAVPFIEFRELWGLPPLELDEEPETEPA
jgi:hypothetical protein